MCVLFAYVFDTNSISHSFAFRLQSRLCSAACKMLKWANHHHQRKKQLQICMYVSMGKHDTKCKAILSNDFCSALLYSTVFDGGGSSGQQNRSWWHIYLATIVFCVSKYVRVNVAAILPFGTQTKHIEPKESRNHFYSKNNEQKFFSSLLLLMCACVFVCMD